MIVEGKHMGHWGHACLFPVYFLMINNFDDSGQNTYNNYQSTVLPVLLLNGMSVM